jgi:hypothetical protein
VVNLATVAAFDTTVPNLRTVAEVMTRFATFATFGTRADFGAWLHTIACNMALYLQSTGGWIRVLVPQFQQGSFGDEGSILKVNVFFDSFVD